MTTPDLLDAAPAIRRIPPKPRQFKTRTRTDWRATIAAAPDTDRPQGMEPGTVIGQFCAVEIGAWRYLYACPLPGGDGRRYWLELTPDTRQAEAWDNASGTLTHAGTLDRIGVERMIA
jgi:hypothetical protein